MHVAHSFLIFFDFLFSHFPHFQAFPHFAPGLFFFFTILPTVAVSEHSIFG